jgi:hypothetical protein
MGTKQALGLTVVVVGELGEQLVGVAENEKCG